VRPTDEVAGPSLTDVVRRLLDGPRPLPLVTAGHPVLRHPAAPYDFSLPAEVFAELIEAMRETMHAAPGVGLAAPQIGLGLAVAVLEDSAPVPDEVAQARDRRPLPFRVIVNPAYEAVGPDRAAWYEGCLSVPGYQAVVERAARVRLRCLDQTGAPVDEEIAGWAARIVAHETDHLNGTLYLDRALLRSLATHRATAAWWGGPDLTPARVALGF
jgi:peptide deformylase